eukprot:PhF_6_TR27329/c0_g1_i1/m.40150/K08266/MLST8, GBL; target of rapamycin complex subunit LST8
MPQPIILATASYDRNIRFWEPSTGICVRQLQFQESQVNCMAISPDKSRLAAGGFLHLKLFDLTTSSQTHVASCEAHTQNISGIGYTKSGLLFTCSEDGHIKLWEPKKLTLKMDFDVKNPVTCIALHPNQDDLICGDGAGGISVFRMSTEITPTGSSTALQQQLLPGGDVPIRSIAVNGAGDVVVAANNVGNVFVFSCRQTNVTTTPQQASSTLSSSSPNTPILGSENPTPSAEYLQLINSFRAHTKYILRIALSSDSKLLATASADYTIAIWNIPQDDLSKPFTNHKTLVGHQRWVWDISMTQDSQYLVSVSSDHSGRLWDINKEKSIVVYNGHHKPVTCLVLDDRVVPAAAPGI